MILFLWKFPLFEAMVATRVFRDRLPWVQISNVLFIPMWPWTAYVTSQRTSPKYEDNISTYFRQLFQWLPGWSIWNEPGKRVRYGVLSCSWFDRKFSRLGVRGLLLCVSMRFCITTYFPSFVICNIRLLDQIMSLPCHVTKLILVSWLKYVYKPYWNP